MKLDNISASIPDDRDYPYIPQGINYPPKLDLKPEVFEIEDQLTVGSCTDNAKTSDLEMMKKEDYSRLFGYWCSRNLIEGRPNQEGASLRDAIRAGYHYGVPLETSWPYDVSKVNVMPPQNIFDEALQKRITRYERIDTSTVNTWEGQQAIIHTIKSALNEGLAVVFAVHVGKDIRDTNIKGPWQTHKMRPTALGLYINNGNEWIGNHAMLIIGYDDTIPSPCPGWNMNGSFLVQNSWGSSYGDGGFLGYPYQALVCDIMEAWVIRGFANINNVPDPQYITQPQVVINDWYWPNFRRDVTDPMDEGVQYWAKHPGGELAFLDSYLTVITERVNLRKSQLLK